MVKLSNEIRNEILEKFKNKMEFYKAQARDRDKKQWCELNEIALLELFHNESIEEWRDKIWKT